MIDQRDAEPTGLGPTMRVGDAAALLGVGRTTLYQAIKRGEMPVLRIGGRIFIRRATVDRLLADGPHPDAGAATGTRRDLPPPAPTTKICRTCREEKPLREFSHDGSQPDRHDAYCRRCRSEQYHRQFPRRRGSGPDAALVSAAARMRAAHQADAARRAAPFLAAEPGRWGTLPFPAVDAEGRICRGERAHVH